MASKYRVQLLTHSYGIVFEWAQVNVGTEAAPQYKFELRETLKAPDTKGETKEEWYRLRDEIFKLCQDKKQKPCGNYVINDYVYQLKRNQAITPNVVPQIAPWSSEIFPKKGDTFDIDLPPYSRNVIMVGYDKNGKPFGFVLANANKTTTYIDVICGSPGQILLRSFLEWSGRRHVRLSSLLNVIQYYPKYGFEFGKCGENTKLTEMVKRTAPGAFANLNALKDDAREVISLMREKGIINASWVEPELCAKDKETGVFLRNQCMGNGVQMERCQPKKFVFRKRPVRSRRDITLRTDRSIAFRTRSKTRKK